MALEFAHGAIQWLTSDALNADLTVSGLSFQPKALRFYWVGLQSATDAASQTVSARRGVGFASDSTGSIVQRVAATMSTDASSAGASASVVRNDRVVTTLTALASQDGGLSLQSFNSDGFTLNVDDVTPANVTVFWEAWGGTDITNVTIGDIAEPAATGTQNYTATGFTSTDDDSQVVMLAGIHATAAVNTSAITDSNFCVGFATGTASAENVLVLGNSDSGSATIDSDGYALSGECLAKIVDAGGNPNARATLSAFGTDLFTLDWLARATTNRRNIYMAIKGGSWKAGDFIIGASAGSTTTISGLAFTPKGVCMMGHRAIENTAGTSNTQDWISIGTATSTSSRRAMGVLDENGTASVEIDTTIQYDQVLAWPDTTGALLSALDINAMNSDGFQVIVDVNGIANQWQGYLTFGDAPAAASEIPHLVMAPMQPSRWLQ